MLRWILLLAVVPTWLAPHLACAADASSEPSVLIQTAVAMKRNVVETVTAFGTIEPDADRVLSVSVPHGGLVDRVWVRVGQRVERGTSLAELISNPADHMQFLQAQSALDFASHELQRQQQLFTAHIATRAQVAEAQRSLIDAQATLDSLRSQGKGQAAIALQTPIDGIVTRVDVQAGQRVAAGTTALLIAAEDRLVAILGVEPENATGIHPGAQVTLTSVFSPEFRLNAAVSEVHAMVNPATLLVDVLVPLPPEPRKDLVLGSHIEGQIRLKAHIALTVPRTAVLRDEHGAYVFKVSNAHAIRVAVTPGDSTEDDLEVSGRLEAGDRIVTSGNYELRDGMQVREPSQ